MKKSLLFFLMLLPALIPLRAADKVTLFSITEYSQTAPTGWTYSNIQNETRFIKMNAEGYIQSPSYAPHNNVVLTYKIAKFGSGTNPKISIQVCNSSDNSVITTIESSQPTSSTYISDSKQLGNITSSFYLKLSNPKNNAIVRLQEIVLTGEAVSTSSKIDPNLTWSATSATAKIGETPMLPTLTNTYGVTVSYSSSNTGVATIDASGNVTLVAAGTTTIKAESAANSTYSASSASYTLTVSAADTPTPDPQGTLYRLVKSAADITTGDEYIIVSAKSGSAKAMSEHNNASISSNASRKSVDVTISDETINITNENVSPFYLVNGQNEGYYAIKFLNNNYLILSGTSSSTGYRENTALNQNADFKYQFDANSNEITFSFKAATTRGIRYNDSNSDFRSYTVSSGTAVYLFKKVETKTKTTLTWSPSEFNYVLGSEAAMPTLTVTPTEASNLVKFNWEGDNVGTYADGKLSLTARGNATLTASIAANEKYLASSAVLTIHVTKQTKNLSWSVNELTLDLFQTPEVWPTLTKDADISVSYASSNENIATIDENGNITLKNVAGETTISAIYAGDETFEPAKADYKLTVNKLTASLSWGTESFIYKLGQVNELPTLSGVPTGATVTYTSSNEDVATIDVNGAIEVKGEGTTTITASLNAEHYATPTASYTLVVEDPSNIKTYTLVSDASKLKNGDKIIIASKLSENTTYDGWYAISSTQSSSNRAGVKVDRIDDNKTIINPGSNIQVITLVKNDDNSWSFAVEGGYLCHSTSNNQLKITDTNENNIAKANIDLSLTAAGNSTIQFLSSSRQHLYCNLNKTKEVPSPIYAAYASNSATNYLHPQIFKLDVPSVDAPVINPNGGDLNVDDSVEISVEAGATLTYSITLTETEEAYTAYEATDENDYALIYFDAVQEETKVTVSATATKGTLTATSTADFTLKPKVAAPACGEITFSIEGTDIKVYAENAVKFDYSISYVGLADYEAKKNVTATNNTIKISPDDTCLIKAKPYNADEVAGNEASKTFVVTSSESSGWRIVKSLDEIESNEEYIIATKPISGESETYVAMGAYNESGTRYGSTAPTYNTDYTELTVIPEGTEKFYIIVAQDGYMFMSESTYKYMTAADSKINHTNDGSTAKASVSIDDKYNVAISYKTDYQILYSKDNSCFRQYKNTNKGAKNYTSVALYKYVTDVNKTIEFAENVEYPIPAPVFAFVGVEDLDNMEFLEEAYVEINDDVNKLPVFATLDGTNPTVESDTSAAYFIDDDTTIKAYVYDEVTGLKSRVVSVSLKLFDATVYASTHVAFKPMKANEALTTVEPGSKWTESNATHKGYLLCGEIADTEHDGNIHVHTISVDANGSTIAAVKANHRADGNIYLQKPKDEKEDATAIHKHREFYAANAGAGQYYFWARINKQNKVLSTTPGSSDLYLETIEEAEANGHVYTFTIEEGGSNSGNGGVVDAPARRIVAAPGNPMSIVFGGTDTLCFNEAAEGHFFTTAGTLSAAQSPIVIYASENGATTGVENVDAEAVEGETEYFNLQGIRVENPGAGIYIRRTGNASEKVLVK